MNHRKYRVFYGISFYSSYYYEHVETIQQSWRDSGGRVSNINPHYFYGNATTMANFYLICDLPVKLIDVSNDVGKNLAKDMEQYRSDDGEI